MFNIEKCIVDALRRATIKGQSISHDKLAADAGISKQTLYNIFSRDDAKLSHLYSLANALGVSIYETFEVKGEDLSLLVKRKSPELFGLYAGSSQAKIKELEEKNALYEEYIDNLKGFNRSLEREIKRLQEEKGGGRSGGVKQFG